MTPAKKEKSKTKKIIPLSPPSSREFQDDWQSIKNKQQRLQAIKELIKENPPYLIRTLIDLLADPGEDIREFIVNFLAREESSLPLEILVDKLREPPWYRKTALLKIIAHRRETLLLDSLSFLTNDSNAAVRCELAQTLGQLAIPPALHLLSKMTKDSNPYVRRTAEKALAKASKIRFI